MAFIIICLAFYVIIIRIGFGLKIDDLEYELKNIDDKCKSYERRLNSIMLNDCITDDEEAEKIIKESKSRKR